MTTTGTRIPEIFMEVIDHTKIGTLLFIQKKSRRQLAAFCGFKSHTYVNRIVAGEVNNVTPETAARIARFFGVNIGDLFVPRLSTDGGRPVQRKGTAA